MLLVDAPNAASVTNQAMRDVIASVIEENAKNTALYFPRLRAADAAGRIREFAPCGAVAGVIARMDDERAVWQAPAGTEAAFQGMQELSRDITDAEQGALNALGVNCLRRFSGDGVVIWGARTLAGADSLASEWKYLPVRRLALFLEESIDQGTRWAAFEPNDERLWATLRLNIEAFLHHLFRSGAFAGQREQEAYFVRCDRTTMSEADIAQGRVIILVGFAPLRPGEFVLLRIGRWTAQGG
jgi:uncharacterized protein